MPTQKKKQVPDRPYLYVTVEGNEIIPRRIPAGCGFDMLQLAKLLIESSPFVLPERTCALSLDPMRQSCPYPVLIHVLKTGAFFVLPFNYPVIDDKHQAARFSALLSVTSRWTQ